MKRILLYGFFSLLLISIVIWIIVVKLDKSETVSNRTEIKLVALGDSLTHGSGDQSGQGYVDNLQKLFDQNYKNKVTVKNCGIPGQQSDGLLHQLGKSDVQNELTDADYFIIFIGTNDLIKSNGGDLAKLHTKKIQNGKADYQNNLENILGIIRGENPKAPILFLGLYNPFPSSNKIENVVDEWNKTSKQIVSQNSHVKFIPTNDLFKNKSKKHFSDSLHPNKQGYDLITKRILKEYDF